MKCRKPVRFLPFFAFVAITWLLVSTGAAAQGSSAPKLEVTPEEVDLGTVSNYAPATATLTLHNAGDADLLIKDVKTSCGCTVAEPAANVVKPGESTTVKVTVDPMKVHSFTIAKTVSIFTTDPNRGSVTVPIKGEIRPEFSITPEKIDFGTVKKGESAERTAIFRSLGKEPVLLTSVQSPELPAGFEISQTELPKEEWQTPGEPEFRITVRLQPDAPAGAHHCFLTVATTCPRVERYNLPLEARVSAPYSLNTSTIMLAVAYPGAERPRALTVQADEPLKIEDITSPSDILSFTPHYSEDQKTATFDMVISSTAPPQIINTPVRFKVEMNGKTYEESVTVRGVVRDQPIPVAPTTSQAQ